MREYSKGSICFNDLSVLLDACQGRDTIVELGTNIGTTTKVLAVICNNLTTVDVFENLHLIEDTHQQQIYKESFKHNQHTLASVKKSLHSFKNVKIIKDTTVNASHKFANTTIDAIFIDADHSYAGVKKDFEAWYSKVKRDGIFLFHDMVSSFPVYKLYPELLADIRLEEVPHEYSQSSIKIFKKRA